MAPENVAIAFENVSKAYEAGARPALDGVSLTVAQGEFLAVVGASGSGKTTLLRLVNRLTDPTSGTVRVSGTNVRTTDAVSLRRQIGYVFQGIGLFPHMTVAENIAVTPKLLGADRRQMAARVDELLDLARLDRTAYRDRFPRELSGGERQRVGVARAIAAKPQIVLMDEPFGALDPLTRDALGQDYRSLHDALGLTTVMVTHDIVEALLLADRIAIMQQGRVLEHGTPHALMQSRQAGVRDLMQTPRRQAQRLGAMLAGGSAA
ncbi:MAG: ATP-binding cassette domain-containing protein [Rhizobiales bacterium]|nr:ATP-binding cassette domain-containing protein [Hyphomicrobiales bacterium]